MLRTVAKVFRRLVVTVCSEDHQKTVVRTQMNNDKKQQNRVKLIFDDDTSEQRHASAEN